VMNNVRNAGFAGAIWPVNPHYDSVYGLQCWPTVAALPGTPDLAVIATPAATVPGLIAELGVRGNRAAVVLTAGLTRESGLRQAMLDAARPHNLRIIGPNCLGLFVPAIGLNASDGTAELGDLLSVDATTAPQADGAPLVDGTGAVTGVVTTVSSATGVIAASGRDAATLVSGVQRGSTASTGSFGVTSALIDASVSAAASLPQGALIQSVSPTGAAAGLLQPGDVVTAVDGTSVVSAGGFQPGDFGLLVGDKAALQVTGAGGTSRTVTVTVAPG